MSFIEEINSEIQKDNPDLEKIKKIIINGFEIEFGLTYNNKTSDHSDKLDRWINSLEMKGGLNFYKRISIPLRVFFHTLSSKVSWAAQHGCLLCSKEFPTHIMPIRIPPHSHQSGAVMKKAFKEEVREFFKEKKIEDFKKSKVCIHLVFVCSKNRPAKDVDNMAKLMLDALKNILFGDDKDIDHLSVLKLYHKNDEEFVYINIRKSKINSLEDVLIDEFRHRWGNRSMIDLSKYMTKTGTGRKGRT